ncbi:Type IV fimbrial biogenesis protein PilY1 [hydrothermal vent metagenome]|uniref:Type IV fimbrial biogenesis protein PilY1 n=1 Tax=hydrothermal vent metagenome TaxID=652676 RepID=A0A3B0Z4J9_9ZZZZ
MNKYTKIISTTFLIVLSYVALAQDTELYVNNVNSGEGARPKVLIIFDNSGSMSNIVPGTQPSYDSSIIYNPQGSINSTRLYWSKSGTPPSENSSEYILVDSNRCASSQGTLNTTGFYTDFSRVWRANKEGKLRWRSVSNNSGTRNSSFIDCYRDYEDQIATNPGSPAQADGYPLSKNSGPYTINHGSSNAKWNSNRTFFTANYMNWYHDSSLGTDRKRIDIAKDVVTNIIGSNPNVDFGMMVFNHNGSGKPSGGRVVRKIDEDMTMAQRDSLKTMVNSLTPFTWTPLCETLYEAYRYFGALGVYYGDDDPLRTPLRDMMAENDGTYISPMGDCQQVYVILMTDGEPTYDTNANGLIGNLPGIGPVSGNRLDELAGWLYANDLDGDSTNGIQRVVTYTVGFTSDQTLLSDTAEKGGGRYYTADSASELSDAFQSALNEILQTDTTFTSPAVAVNSFNRSRSLDDVYIAMFRPQVGPRWAGNLKKLTINSTGTLVDANGVAAIDPATGSIKDTAQTVWSTSPDGGSVLEGGVGALLAARDPSTRVLKTNTGSESALEMFNTSNSNLTNSHFGVATTAERDALINWVRGVDIDDEDEDGSDTDTRPWIVGDPLHSRPLVLNYGARPGYTISNPDMRILMGTNHGVLHMFGASDGAENWAFLPKELLTINDKLRTNASSDAHLYGVDGSTIAYVYDQNNDGTISGSSDKVYLYVGLRRGGNAYYALDITNPDNPIFKWRIDASSTGFSELGQSWSTPIITKIPGFSGPVLVISGGYDTNKDLKGVVGTADSEGRGVYIVNALTGTLIWSATPAANSAINLQVSDLTDSVPSTVSVIDSNSDSLSDRIYFGDTGGNVWRIDMPGNSLPTSSQNTWSMFKVASLGGTTSSTDRRFFNQIDIVQTRSGSLDYDALALGSGNRSHPNNTTVNDRFYMLRDTLTKTAYYGAGGLAVPTTLIEADLYDATSNVIQNGNASEKTVAVDALAVKNGWYIALERSGEKSMSASLTLDGTVYFTTFAPDSSILTCVPVPGEGYLYAVDLHEATAVFEWDSSTSDITKEDRTVSVGGRLPDSVTPHFGEDQVRIIGVGAGEQGKGSYDTGSALTTLGIYWYQETQ